MEKTLFENEKNSLIKIITDNILLFFGSYWTNGIKNSIIHNIKADLLGYNPRYFKRKFKTVQQTYVSNLDIDLHMSHDSQIDCYLDNELVLTLF